MIIEFNERFYTFRQSTWPPRAIAKADSLFPLPKWPQMVVAGEKISEKDALEIIRRTDDHIFAQYSNDKVWLKTKNEIFKDISQGGDIPDDWGFIITSYIQNQWVDSSFIYGNHGWCRPDGTIEYHYNCGKWPSLTGLVRDWCMIGTKFPFLKLVVVLMDNESAELNKAPVFGLHMHDRICELFSGVKADEMIRFYNPQGLNNAAEHKFNPNDLCLLQTQHAISIAQIQEWVKQYNKQKEKKGAK